MNATVGNLIVIAVFAVFVVLGLRIRYGPGGPLMFRLQHPRVSVVFAALFWVVGVSFLVGTTVAELPEVARPAFRDYLVRIVAVALPSGTVVTLVEFFRGGRDARQLVSTFRVIGEHGWLLVVLVPAIGVIGVLFNPVPMAWSAVPGIVGAAAFLIPSLILSAVRAFFFAQTLPTTSEVAAALLHGPPTDSTTAASHDIAQR